MDFFFPLFGFLSPEEEPRWCFSPQIWQGQRDAAKLAQSFTKTRVAILPLPVPHTRPPLNSLPTHSFPLPLFVSWEDTSLEKPLRRLFKSLCVAGWQRTPLCFFSHLENLSETEKRVLSSLREDPPLYPPTSPRRPLPQPGWTPTVSSQTSPVCAIPAVLWETDKEQEAQGSTGQAWRSAQSVSGWWMWRRGQVTWNAPNKKVRNTPSSLLFPPSLTRLQTARKGTLPGDFSVSMWRDINRNWGAAMLLIYRRYLVIKPLMT